MNSGFLKLDLKDFGKGFLVAVIAAVLAKLGDYFNMPGFEITALNWGEIANIGITAGLAYLAKNLFSNSEGKVLGRW